MKAELFQPVRTRFPNRVEVAAIADRLDECLLNVPLTPLQFEALSLCVLPEVYEDCDAATIWSEPRKPGLYDVYDEIDHYEVDMNKPRLKATQAEDWKPEYFDPPRYIASWAVIARLESAADAVEDDDDNELGDDEWSEILQTILPEAFDESFEEEFDEDEESGVVSLFDFAELA